MATMTMYEVTVVGSQSGWADVKGRFSSMEAAQEYMDARPLTYRSVYGDSDHYQVSRVQVPLMDAVKESTAEAQKAVDEFSSAVKSMFAPR